MRRIWKHIKENTLVGVFILVRPAFLLFIGFQILQFITKFVVNYEPKFWNLIADIVPINARITRSVFAGLMLIFPYIFGVVSLKGIIGKQRRLRAKKLKIFVRGGHKRILYRFHGPQTALIPGVAVSRSMNNEDEMLSVVLIQFAIPNPQLIERKYTMVVDHKFKTVWRYVTSFGTISMKNWKARKWTDEEYYAIPHEEDLV